MTSSARCGFVPYLVGTVHYRIIVVIKISLTSRIASQLHLKCQTLVNSSISCPTNLMYPRKPRARSLHRLPSLWTQGTHRLRIITGQWLVLLHQCRRLSLERISITLPFPNLLHTGVLFAILGQIQGSYFIFYLIRAPAK